MVNAGFQTSHQQGVSCPSQVISSSCSTPYILILSCISHKMRLDNYIQRLIIFLSNILYVTEKMLLLIKRLVAEAVPMK